MSAASQWCLDQGKDVRCPPWCHSTHLDAISEGCGLETMYEHSGANFGEILTTLVRPNSDQVLRAGGGHWEIRAEMTQGPTGWDSATWFELRVGAHGESEGRIIMTPGELREMARLLERAADIVALG